MTRSPNYLINCEETAVQEEYRFFELKQAVCMNRWRRFLGLGIHAKRPFSNLHRLGSSMGLSLAVSGVVSVTEEFARRRQ